MSSTHLDESVWNINYNLERYHGICAKRLGLEECGENGIETIIRELEKGKPVGLVINIAELSFFMEKMKLFHLILLLL